MTDQTKNRGKEWGPGGAPDLVERLREARAVIGPNEWEDQELPRQAADEIERLRLKIRGMGAIIAEQINVESSAGMGQVPTDPEETE